MNTKLIVGVAGCAVLAAAIVGGAAFTGHQTKKRLQAEPLAWQTQWPLLKVVNQSYERHLFSATHTVTFQLGCAPTAGGEPMLLTLVQRVQHGPLPGFKNVAAAVIESELVWSEAPRQPGAERTAHSPLTAHTVVGLTGAHHTHFAIPPLQYRGPKGEQIDWQGLQVDLDGRGAALHYEVSMPGASLSVRDEKMSVDMKFAGLQAHGEMSGGGALWLRPGKAEGELASLELSAAGPAGASPPPMKLSLSKVKLSGATSLDNGLLSSTSQLTGRGMAGEVKLDNIELQASFKRLHAAGYAQLMQHVMEMSNVCDASQAAVAPQMMLTQMQRDLVGLLPFNPEYSLDKLALEIDGKRGEASYLFGVNGVSEAELKLPLPALLMSKTQLRGQIKLPLSWIEQAVAHFGGAGDTAAQAEMVNVMLTQMTTNGFVVREGDMLSTQFSMDKGQMLVNGKPIGGAAAPGR